MGDHAVFFDAKKYGVPDPNVIDGGVDEFDVGIGAD